MKHPLGILSVVLLLSAACHAQTISVTPANVGSVVVAANAGATFSFAPGTYSFTTNPSGPAADWSSVPGAFIGNGAIMALSGGVAPNEHQELIKFAPGSAVSGFVFTDAQIHCEGGTFSVTGNTFQNGYRGIFVASNSGHFDGNTIAQMSNEGIYGYPGPNCTYSNNVIDSTGNDGIHLVGSPNSVTLDSNVITNCSRIGIELQNGFTNLAVTNNYVSIIQPGAPSSYMAYSIATGNGNNITLSGNTGVSSRIGAGACFEVMGSNASIANNISWGFGQYILNGAQGATLNTTNNVVYGGIFAADDGVNWAIANIVSTGDTNPPLPISAMPKAPAPPNAGQLPVLVAAPIVTTPTTPVTVAAPIVIAPIATTPTAPVTVAAPTSGSSSTSSGDSQPSSGDSQASSGGSQGSGDSHRWSGHWHGDSGGSEGSSGNSHWSGDQGSHWSGHRDD